MHSVKRERERETRTHIHREKEGGVREEQEIIINAFPSNEEVLKALYIHEASLSFKLYLISLTHHSDSHSLTHYTQHTHIHTRNYFIIIKSIILYFRIRIFRNL